MTFKKIIKYIMNLFFVLQIFFSCSNDNNKDIIIVINPTDVIYKKYQISKIIDTNKKISIFFTKKHKIKNIELIRGKDIVVVKAKYKNDFFVNEIDYLIQNSLIQDIIFFANTNINTVKVKSIRYIWTKYKSVFYFVEEIKPYFPIKKKNKILLFRNIYYLTNKKFLESEMIYMENEITNKRYLNYKEHKVIIRELNLDKINNIINLNTYNFFPKNIGIPKNKTYLSNIVKLIHPAILLPNKRSKINGEE